MTPANRLGLIALLLGLLLPGAASPAPDVLLSFDGHGQPANWSVPDTSLAVGPNHVVEAVNQNYAIYAKDGTPIVASATLASLFPTSPCSTYSTGFAPGVLHDQLADRWLIHKLVVSGTAAGSVCIAVSQTPDPTGAWYTYHFIFSTTDFYDDWKIGLWPDGYYATATIFAGGTSFAGTTVIAFNRAAMLAGLASTPQVFPIAASPLFGVSAALVPADLDGSTPPPAGAPAYLVNRAGASNLQIYRLHVDWVTPGNSLLTGPTDLATSPYTALCPSTPNCLPQPATATRLNGRGSNLLERMPYRNFGSHESLLATHAVATGSGNAGMRWYELRVGASAPSIFQQGTFAPADGVNRWLGSAVFDASSNIALGYSAVSSSVFPGLRFTGRTPAEPAGTMSGEGTLVDGGGSQTFGSPWGFHASTAADAGDDCVLWFASEYYAATSSFGWRTRIGAVRFPSCAPPPQVPVFPLSSDGVR